MLELVLNENPIIFPNLVFALGNNGVRVHISGKKRADFKLAHYLLIGLDGITLPEVAIFNLKTGKWEEYWDDKILIHPPVGSSYFYVRPPENGFTNYSLIENFVRLYSSAIITMKHIEL